MSFIHIVNHKQSTVFARVIGDNCVDEIISTIRKLGASSKIPDDYNFLFDLRQSKRVHSHDDATKIIDAYALAFNKFSKKIVFLASKDVQYGVCRMTATLAGMNGYDAYAAKTEEESCELLGIKSIPSDEHFEKNGLEL